MLAPKAQQAGPSAEQLALGEGWSHVVRGGRVAKATATTPPPNPNPPPQPVTEVPRHPKVTATRKKAGPKKPEPKLTAAAQTAAVKSKKKVAASVKTAATKPSTPVLVVPTDQLEEISDVLDRLFFQAYVELILRLLTSTSSLPKGIARPRRPIGDPLHRIPAGIQDEIRLKNRLRGRWQVSRDPALKTEVNRLQRSLTRHLNECRNDQWCATLDSLNPAD